MMNWDLVYCKNITGLMVSLGISSDIKICLFIDGSVSSLKVVLLHATNGNKYPGIPVGYLKKARVI